LKWPDTLHSVHNGLKYPSCCLKSKQEEENQTQMNEDVVSVKQYSLPLLGNQRKEMNTIKSHHNPPKSITNNVEGVGAYL